MTKTRYMAGFFYAVSLYVIPGLIIRSRKRIQRQPE